MNASSVAHPRPVERLVAGRAARDGAGVKVTRVLTQDLQRRLDPLLMFGAFGSDKAEDYIGGFPDHPHRGFETVTYMVAGSMRHRDSAGNEGLVANGGVQWMTAGRGVVHSELPEQNEGRMEGFQLWINLAAKDKLVPAGYRDIPREQIPEWEGEGAAVRVIAGESHGVAGAAYRRQTAERADRAIRTVRDEQQRRDLAGGRGFPRRPARLASLVSVEQRAEVDASSALSCGEDLFLTVLSHPQLDPRRRCNQPRESKVTEMVGRGCAFASIGGVAQDNFGALQIAQLTATQVFADVACNQMAERIVQILVEDARLGAELGVED